MKNFLIYCPIRNKALEYAIAMLPVSPAPNEQVTHLLLPVPSFTPDGGIRGGGDLKTVLYALPDNITIIGGNLSDCLPFTLKNCPILLIGWGRIGKCLARLLRANDALVTVCARKEADRALLQALGYSAQSVPDPTGYRVVINTAPAPVLATCPDTVFKMELSSVMGIAGSDVLWAKGLPAIHAPESSGMLIADTINRLLSKEEEA